jgi:hypothetical protein
MWPQFHMKDQTIVKLPMYYDNLPPYRGFEPYFSKKLKIIADQPQQNKFIGHIEIRQCQAKECEKKTHIQPYCEKHRKEIQKLLIKKSNIKEAGMGLFAFGEKEKIVFKQNDLIGYYQGEILDLQGLRERYGAKYDKSDEKWFTPYAAKCGDSYIDSIIVRTTMSCMNDIRSDWKTNVIEKYDQINNTLKCIAKKDIYHGDELFVNYGISYWISFPYQDELIKY